MRLFHKLKMLDEATIERMKEENRLWASQSAETADKSFLNMQKERNKLSKKGFIVPELPFTLKILKKSIRKRMKDEKRDWVEKNSDDTSSIKDILAERAALRKRGYYVPRLPLSEHLRNTINRENLSMSEGYYHPDKLAAIKEERDALRKQGFNVPKMPVGNNEPTIRLCL
jgi:hypothetical protein